MTEGSRLVVIRARPEVRNVCPEKFLEGWWTEIPNHVDDIAIATPPGARPLKVHKTGRMERNASGDSAAVWEIAWDDFEVDPTLPPDPFYDETSCPIWSCTIVGTHTHDNDDPRLPLNQQR